MAYKSNVVAGNDFLDITNAIIISSTDAVIRLPENPVNDPGCRM